MTPVTGVIAIEKRGLPGVAGKALFFAPMRTRKSFVNAGRRSRENAEGGWIPTMVTA
jgi:hypothetical protein